MKSVLDSISDQINENHQIKEGSELFNTLCADNFKNYYRKFNSNEGLIFYRGVLSFDSKSNICTFLKKKDKNINMTFNVFIKKSSTRTESLSHETLSDEITLIRNINSSNPILVPVGYTIFEKSNVYYIVYISSGSKFDDVIQFDEYAIAEKGELLLKIIEALRRYHEAKMFGFKIDTSFLIYDKNKRIIDFLNYRGKELTSNDDINEIIDFINEEEGLEIFSDALESIEEEDINLSDLEYKIGRIIKKNKNKSKDEQINYIRENIKNLHLNELEDTSLIVFIGPTHIGKSTTINMLRGKKYQFLNNDELVEENEIDDEAEIGDSSGESKTRFPRVYYRNGERVAYLDTRGLFDTRASLMKEEIASTLLIELAVAKAKEVKIVILINYNNFNIAYFNQLGGVISRIASQRKGEDVISFYFLFNRFPKSEKYRLLNNEEKINSTKQRIREKTLSMCSSEESFAKFEYLSILFKNIADDNFGIIDPENDLTVKQVNEDLMKESLVINKERINFEEFNGERMKFERKLIPKLTTYTYLLNTCTKLPCIDSLQEIINKLTVLNKLNQKNLSLVEGGDKFKIDCLSKRINNDYIQQINEEKVTLMNRIETTGNTFEEEEDEFDEYKYGISVLEERTFKVGGNEKDEKTIEIDNLKPWEYYDITVFEQYGSSLKLVEVNKNDINIGGSKFTLKLRNEMPRLKEGQLWWPFNELMELVDIILESWSSFTMLTNLIKGKGPVIDFIISKTKGHCFEKIVNFVMNCSQKLSVFQKAVHDAVILFLKTYKKEIAIIVIIIIVLVLLYKLYVRFTDHRPMISGRVEIIARNEFVYEGEYKKKQNKINGIKSTMGEMKIKLDKLNNGKNEHIKEYLNNTIQNNQNMICVASSITSDIRRIVDYCKNKTDEIEFYVQMCDTLSNAKQEAKAQILKDFVKAGKEFLYQVNKNKLNATKLDYKPCEINSLMISTNIEIESLKSYINDQSNSDIRLFN